VSQTGPSLVFALFVSYLDLEEMMAERGLSLDHSTIARWVLRYAPILSQRIRGELRKPNRSWRVDERTFA
jgi:transposase-like protein